ncbi:hypothetical protein EBU58_11715 [bacterium]|nr:hypothetical protein [bacterium]
MAVQTAAASGVARVQSLPLLASFPAAAFSVPPRDHLLKSGFRWLEMWAGCWAVWQYREDVGDKTVGGNSSVRSGRAEAATVFPRKIAG